MRPLGKILVFLVFLGALAMGGLMIYISKATPNWEGAVEQREKTILKIQEEIRTAKNEEQAAKNLAETASQRALNLLEQVKEKEAVIAQLRKRDEGGKIITSVRDANYNNPPSHIVKG